VYHEYANSNLDHDAATKPMNIFGFRRIVHGPPVAP
jgi:hypothetical protein